LSEQIESKKDATKASRATIVTLASEAVMEGAATHNGFLKAELRTIHIPISWQPQSSRPSETLEIRTLETAKVEWKSHGWHADHGPEESGIHFH
jgi:hypothetical protein